MAKLTPEEKMKKLEKELIDLKVKEQLRADEAEQKKVKEQKKRDDRAKILIGAALLKRMTTSEDPMKTEEWTRKLCEETLIGRDRAFIDSWLNDRAAARAAGTK